MKSTLIQDDGMGVNVAHLQTIHSQFTLFALLFHFNGKKYGDDMLMLIM